MRQLFFFLAVTAFMQKGMAQDTTINGYRYRLPVTFTAQQDHDDMMRHLGITELRPGPSDDANSPNHANYDEGTANPCPQLPDLLRLKDGKKVKTPDMWWKQRRPEIVADLESEVYGRVPGNIPRVIWTVKVTDSEWVGDIPVIAKELVGHVDNSEYPLIDVDIKMVLVVPANVKGPVPVLMMFGRVSGTMVGAEGDAVGLDPPYYHQAGANGIGFDRTTKGSDAVSQYHEPLASEVNDVATCPEKYLLWFHHLPWNYPMKNGQTLWDALCYHYDKGVGQVREFQKIWDKVQPFIDSARFTEVQVKLRAQCANAILWKDASLLYFQQYSRMPIPYDIERPVRNLDDIMANEFKDRVK